MVHRFFIIASVVLHHHHRVNKSLETKEIFRRWFSFWFGSVIGGSAQCYHLNIDTFDFCQAIGRPGWPKHIQYTKMAFTNTFFRHAEFFLKNMNNLVVWIWQYQESETNAVSLSCCANYLFYLFHLVDFFLSKSTVLCLARIKTQIFIHAEKKITLILTCPLKPRGGWWPEGLKGLSRHFCLDSILDGLFQECHTT